MNKTDLSILAMLKSQTNGPAKTADPISGDGAFLAVLGQKTVQAQVDTLPIADKSAFPQPQQATPPTQVADQNMQAVQPQIHLGAPQVTETLLGAEGRVIRAADYHTAQRSHPAPPMSLLQPSLDTEQPPTLDEPTPENGDLGSQISAFVRDSVKNTPIAKPKDTPHMTLAFDADLPAQSTFPHWTVPHSMVAEMAIDLPQANAFINVAQSIPTVSKTNTDTASTEISLGEVATPELNTMQPSLEFGLPPLSGVAMQTVMRGNQNLVAATGSAALAPPTPFATAPPKPIGPATPIPTETRTLDATAPDSSPPFERLQERTRGALQAAAPLVQPAGMPFQNQPAYTGQDLSSSTLPFQSAPSLPTKAGFVEAPSTPTKFSDVSAPGQRIDFTEITRAAKPDFAAKLGETSQVLATSSDKLTLAVAPENAPRTNANVLAANGFDAPAKANLTGTTGPVPVLNTNQPVLQVASLPFPRNEPVQFSLTTTSPTRNYETIEDAPSVNSLPNTPALKAQPTQHDTSLPPVAKPMPQAEAKIDTLGLPPSAPTAKPVADRIEKTSAIQQSPPIDQDVRFTAINTSSGAQTFDHGPPTSDIAPLIIQPTERVPPAEQKSPYESVFASTGFSAAASPSLVSQTSSVQIVPVPVASLAEQIKTHARPGKPSTIELTLTPEDLGKIRLVMAPDGDKIRIVVHADRPETLELIRRNADSFSADLRQAGYSNASFTFGGWNGRQSAQQDQQTTNQRFESAIDDADDLITPQKPQAIPPKLSGLNLRV